MGEKMHLSEQETGTEVRDSLEQLANMQPKEVLAKYPKTSEQVKRELQSVATALQKEITDTRSSTEQNNDRRWNFIVKNDTKEYYYMMESFGINTKFKFVPTWRGEEGKLVLYYGLENTEYMEVALDSWKDTDAIKKFLWWVNSANKEIALCNEYAFLEQLPDLLKNPANKKYYKGYYEKYTKIMQEESFENLTFETSSRGSRPLIDRKWKKAAFMDTRWEAIKERVKPNLEKMFSERWYRSLGEVE